MNDLIIIGIILSILYYEFTEVSPGGIVVPAYIALYILQPEKILSTILISVLTLFAVNLLSRILILYGKRKFGVMVIISFFFRWMLYSLNGTLLLPLSLSISSIGYIIPGIIAQDIDKQGFIKTISSMLIVAILARLVFIIINNGVYI